MLINHIKMDAMIFAVIHLIVLCGCVHSEDDFVKFLETPMTDSLEKNIPQLSAEFLLTNTTLEKKIDDFHKRSKGEFDNRIKPHKTLFIGQKSGENRTSNYRYYQCEENQELCDASKLPKSTASNVLPFTIISMSQLQNNVKLLKIFNIEKDDFLCQNYNTSLNSTECIRRLEAINLKSDVKISICSMFCDDDSVFDGIGCTKHHECRNTYTLSAGAVSCQVDFRPLTKEQIPHVKKSSYGICKISNSDVEIEVNDCENETDGEEETVTWIRDTDGSIYPLEKFSTKRNQNLLNINSYHCERKCKIESCRKGKCNGDSTYCSIMSCQKHEKECYCSYMPNTDTVIFQIQKEEIRPMCWGTSKFSVTRRVESFGHYVKTSCEKCTFKCTKYGLEVTSPERKIQFLRICKNPLCVEHFVDSKIFSMELSSKMLTSVGSMFIDVWFPGALEPYTMETSCKPENLCDVIECYICAERWYNINCYNWIMWLLISLLGIILIVTAFYIKYRIAKFIDSKIKGSDNSLHEQLKNYLNGSKTTFEPIKPSAPIAHLRRNSKGSLSSVIFAIITICVKFQSLTGCAMTKQITATSSSCTTSQTGVESCTLTHSLRISIAPIGQISCYTILDSTSKPIGALTFETQSIDLICSKDTLYYTPNAIHECKSTRNCGGTDACSKNRCSSVKVDETFDHWGEANQMMGWTGCKPSCGCAACNCFYCTEACHFYRAYFKNPTKEAYEVFECPTWSFRVKLKVSKVTITESDTESISLQSGVDKEIFGVTLSLVSISVPQLPVLNKCFIRSKTSLAVVDCAKRFEIHKGIVGEIQCPTIKDAEYISKKCHGDSSLITVTEVNEYLTCRSETISLKQIVSDYSLPRKYKDINLFPENETVSASVSGSAIMEIQLDMKDFTLQAKTDKNECFVSFLSLDGCFSCTQGAILQLKHHTNFRNAVGNIQCPNINFRMPLVINSAVETKNYTIHLDYDKINSECTIACPAGDNKFTIKGDLQVSITHDFTNTNQTVGIEIEKEGGWTIPSLWKLSWFKTIMTILLSLTVLFTVLFVIKIVLKMIPRAKSGD